MKPMKVRAGVALLGAAGLLLAGCTSAEAPDGDNTGAPVSDFPNQRIEFIVPFAAGGGTDALGRLWAGCLETSLGETVTVVNVEGGAGAVGALQLANSEPDGYTVGISTATTTQVIPGLDPNVGYGPDSYDYLGLVGISPDVIFVSADSEYDSVEDVIDAARADSSLLVAGFVETSSSRFRPEEFKIANDIQWSTLPFPTADGIVGAVLGGEAEVAYSYLSIPLVEQVNAGALKILGAGLDISAAVPDVPTYEDLGIDAFSGPNAVNFYIHAPVGLPQDVVDVWSDAINECRSDDRLLELLEVSALPADITGQAVIDFADAESVAYQEYIQNSYPPQG